MRRLIPVILILFWFSSASAQWEQTAGPVGSSVDGFSVNSSNSYIFAVANGTALRSVDGGISWTTITNGIPGNFAAAVIFSNAGNTYLAGPNTTVGAPIIYHSTNNGDTWTPKAATGLPFAVFYALTVSGPILLAGMSGDGVYKSTNNGETWTLTTGMPAGLSIGYFAIRGSEVYAGSSVIASTEGIYRSKDNGDTWTATNVTFLTGFQYMTGLTANAAGLYAATSTNGVHKTDTGAI